MIRTITLRLIGAIPNLIGVVVVTFLLTRALPGDPAARSAIKQGGACNRQGSEADGRQVILDLALHLQVKVAGACAGAEG